MMSDRYARLYRWRHNDRLMEIRLFGIPVWRRRGAAAFRRAWDAGEV